MKFSQHWSDHNAPPKSSKRTWFFWLLLLCLLLGGTAWMQWESILGTESLFEEDTQEVLEAGSEIDFDDSADALPIAGITLPDILPDSIDLTEEDAPDPSNDSGVWRPDRTMMQWVTYQTAAKGKSVVSIVLTAPHPKTPPSCSADATKALEAALALDAPLAFSLRPEPCALKDWLPRIQSAPDHQLLLALGAETNAEHLQTLSALLPDAVGVTTSLDHTAPQKSAPLRPLFTQLHKEGLFYLGDAGPLTALAKTTETPYLIRDLIAPAQGGDWDALEKALLDHARAHRRTILEVPMTSSAIAGLGKILPHLRAAHVVVVPPSMLLNPTFLTPEGPLATSPGAI